MTYQEYRNEIERLSAVLAEIERRCQAVAHHGSSPALHEFSSKILQLIGERGAGK
jgi:hypothetical protein